jgi:hypothetical protein
VQALRAHEARATRDVERDHDAVGALELGHAGAGFLDDAHRLVAQDVTLVEERPQHLVEVEVGAAESRWR